MGINLVLEILTERGPSKAQQIADVAEMGLLAIMQALRYLKNKGMVLHKRPAYYLPTQKLEPKVLMSGHCKLTLEQVDEIFAAQGQASAREVAKMFGVTKYVILRVWKGEYVPLV